MLAELETKFKTALSTRDTEALTAILDEIDSAGTKLDMVMKINNTAPWQMRDGAHHFTMGSIKNRKHGLELMQAKARQALERLNAELPCAVGL